MQSRSLYPVMNSRRKEQRLAQERDALLATMTEEERNAWKEEQTRRGIISCVE